MTQYSKIHGCMAKTVLNAMKDNCKEQSLQMFKFLFVFSKLKGITFI